MADQADLLTESSDPDDQILAELEAAEKKHAEEQAALEAGQGEDTAAGAVLAEGEDTTQGAAAEVEAEPAAPAEPMIPKSRFDQVNNRARELEIENARLLGLAEGRKEAADRATAAPAAPAEPKVDPAAVRLTEIEGDGGEIDKLNEAYDAGNMTMTDLERAKRRLRNEADQIRSGIAERSEAEKRRAAPPPQPADPAAAINGDIRLQEATMELVASDPWIEHMPPEYLAEQIVPLAEKLLKNRGQPVTPDAMGTYRLRAATVAVAKAMGSYKLFAPKDQWPSEEGEQPAPAAAAPARPAAPAKPAQRTSTSALTPAQVEEKINLSRRAPPALTDVGTRMPSEIISDADVEGMSEEDLTALPESQLERIAPTRAR